jgi:hypothetical protein
MTYTLEFIGRFGLWELHITGVWRSHFYRTRDEAMKSVTRLRSAKQAQIDREERQEARERESFAQMRWDSYYEGLLGQ